MGRTSRPRLGPSFPFGRTLLRDFVWALGSRTRRARKRYARGVEKASGRAVLWACAMALLTPLRAAAQVPLYDGLPSELSPDYLQTHGFLPFEAPDFSKKGAPPIASGGVPELEPPLPFQEVFYEEHWAFLPPGRPILRRSGPDQDQWEYPEEDDQSEGAAFAHVLGLRAPLRQEPQAAGEPLPPGATLLEIRLLRRLRGGRWAFGLYKAVPGSGALALHREEGARLAFWVELPRGPVRVRMTRLSPAFCAHCHESHNMANWGDAESNRPGPCSFVPENQQLYRWAAEYRARYNSDPFSPPLPPPAR